LSLVYYLFEGFECSQQIIGNIFSFLTQLEEDLYFLFFITDGVKETDLFFEILFFLLERLGFLLVLPDLGYA